MNTSNNIFQTSFWTAMITPLTASGQPDLGSLKTLLREQEEAGNGILILGSTGEGLNLEESERRLVVEFTTSLNLEVPVMVGVGGHQLTEVKQWLRYLETQKIDACLMVTPLYAKPGPEGQYHWFKTLLDFVSRPVMLYNIPSRTGTALHSGVVHRLREHRNFWAIKEASGSVSDFGDYMSHSGDVCLFSGDDVMLPDFAPLGAVGVVSVAGNVWPQATHLYCKMALNNELTEEDVSFWKKAGKSLFVASNPVPAKALLYAQGKIVTPEVKLPLHKDDMKSFDEVSNISRQVTSWYKKKINERVSVGC